VKVSVNDCVVRAVALALRDVPAANASWDAAAGVAVPQPSVDVAIAVATEGGLITPIVKDAASKSLAQVRSQARRARTSDAWKRSWGAAPAPWQQSGRCSGAGARLPRRQRPR
jgi:hypothetical protein